jgi:hypothetical protein
MRRRLTAIIGLIAAGTLLAGCGGGGSGTADSGSDPAGMAKTEDIGAAAMDMAKCMREHGYQVPDPTFDENGLPRFGDAPGVVKNAEFDRVRQRCAESLNAALDAAGVANKKDANPSDLLPLARCMRQHDVDFPDPVGDQPPDIPKNVINSPAWDIAIEACDEFVPDDFRGVLQQHPSGTAVPK